MMTAHIGEHPVTGYDHVVRNAVGGMFHIERHPTLGTWTLWYWDHNKRIVLNHSAHAPITFPMPEEVVDYIDNASPNDTAWADFMRRVGQANFPPGLENEEVWTPLANVTPVLIDYRYHPARF